jgi:hypothetical protein
MFVGALSISVATEKHQCIVEVREVELDGNVMNPGLYSIGVPTKVLIGELIERLDNKNKPFWIDR